MGVLGCIWFFGGILGHLGVFKVYLGVFSVVFECISGGNLEKFQGLFSSIGR